MSAQYAYIGLSGETTVLASTQINFRSAWSVSTSYARLDAVTYNSRWFIAITAHTGVTPPTTFVTETPTYWSPLVLVEGDPQTLDTSSEIAAAAAVGMATLALQTSWSGTEAAAWANALAATGTDAANQAYSLAQLALDTAWYGTGAAAAAQATADSAVAALNTGLQGTVAVWAFTSQGSVVPDIQLTFVNGILVYTSS